MRKWPWRGTWTGWRRVTSGCSPTSPSMKQECQMAKTTEEALQLIIGQLVVRVAELTAQNEALAERLTTPGHAVEVRVPNSLT